MAAESNYTQNGIFPLGKTANDTGTVMVYLRGTMDAGSVTYGYYAGPDDAEVFVPLTSPAPTAFGSIPAVVKLEVGATMRFGIQIAGSSIMDLKVLTSGSY